MLQYPTVPHGRHSGQCQNAFLQWGNPNCTIFVTNREFLQRRRRRHREHQKARGLMGKTTTLHVYHTFWNISLPSPYDYDVK